MDEVNQDREEALGHLRWAMDFMDNAIVGRLSDEAQKSYDDTQAFLNAHRHCNPDIGYHSTPHKGCILR